MKPWWQSQEALVIAGSIILPMGGIFFFVMLKAMSGGSGTLTNTDTVTKATGLVFPKGARVVGGKYTLFMNKIYVVGKVSMPTSTVGGFIRQAGFTRPTMNDSLPLYIQREMQAQDWTPESARRTMTVYKRFPGDESGEQTVTCLFDFDAADHAVLYIYRHW